MKNLLRALAALGVLTTLPALTAASPVIGTSPSSLSFRGPRACSPRSPTPASPTPARQGGTTSSRRWIATGTRAPSPC
jgi:hypothetical protein